MKNTNSSNNKEFIDTVNLKRTKNLDVLILL